MVSNHDFIDEWGHRTVQRPQQFTDHGEFTGCPMEVGENVHEDYPEMQGRPDKGTTNSIEKGKIFIVKPFKPKL